MNLILRSTLVIMLATLPGGYVTLAESGRAPDDTASLYPVAGQKKPGTQTHHRAGTWIDLLVDLDERDVPGNMDFVHEWYEAVPSWAEQGPMLYATNLGRAEWEFTAPVAGMYKFGFCHVNHGGNPPTGYRYRLHFLVDRVRVQTLQVEAVAGRSAWHYVTTPWLTATNHRFRLVWVNWLKGKNTSFGVSEVGLFGVRDSGAGSRGRAKWVEEILAQGNDMDGDGLTDLAEVDTHRTDPLNPDTDGDHLLDGEEVTVFGTNPKSARSNPRGPPDTELLVRHDGIDTLARVDAPKWYWAWWQLGSSLVAKGNNGTLTYAMPLSRPGMYRIGVQLRAWDCEIPDGWKYKVEVSVDGLNAKTMEVFADHDFSGTAYVDTERLEAGNHKVTLKWINSAWVFDPTLRCPNIQIEAISVYGVNSPGVAGGKTNVWKRKQ